MAWISATEDIERAIAKLDQVPNLNVEFGVGYALGLITAAKTAEAISREQYESYLSRISALHKRLIAVYQRTGRTNTILAGDIQ